MRKFLSSLVATACVLSLVGCAASEAGSSSRKAIKSEDDLLTPPTHG